MQNFFWPDIRWKFRKLHATFNRLFLLPFINIPTDTKNAYNKYIVEKNLAIKMRDGVQLYADVYKPAAPGKFPVILIRMPYGKTEYYCYMPAHGAYWAKKGYICVIQDVRGKWASEGVWDPFVNEAQDGYDTLDWIASQQWCDGNIGMTGESYYGYTQWAVAHLNHPNLKCIVPGDTSANIYGTWVTNNHAFCMKTLGIWAIEMNCRTYANFFRLDHWHLPLHEIDEKAGLPCPYYKEWINHPERDEYWERINVDNKYNQIRIPVLNWGGWYDVFVQATIDDWRGMIANAKDESIRDNQWLLIAPTDHELTPWVTGKIGKLKIGNNAWSFDRIQRFFDFYLRGIDNGLKEQPRIEIYVIGDNQWRIENEWPLARTKYTNYYLHSQGRANTLAGDGELSTYAPDDNEPSDHFIYDPENPVKVSLEMEDLWSYAKFMKDRRGVEKRRDVLVYTSDVLQEDLEITGPISMTLYAASTARDTDFTATLVDIFPNNYAHMIQEGIIRARYRNQNGKPSFIEPGKVYEYKIDLWSTSYVIKKGHRIRVEVSSSNFNRYDRNLNTGKEMGLSAEIAVANQTIFHNQDYPSHITLPVIPR